MRSGAASINFSRFGVPLSREKRTHRFIGKLRDVLSPSSVTATIFLSRYRQFLPLALDLLRFRNQRR
ncbi:hypothetical protein M5W78_20070 [Paenibacillus larvae]|uniref:hypothetical protein n=1 Tax=Paenibacillus larvae TaxID=1464 RepID=UPI002280F935|nr:hypothetical protein [Paenibacillus larvae]MCY9512162.1 hypothetical protein [Paenibacillus larvae]